ncbi:hypothetical protein FRC03_001600 [Tulasnella sp. 419]|nr:hypothetical protein FRC03_001600 [Tulasnella sp. 419]
MHDIIKHISTGGFWFDQPTKHWVHAGRAIMSYIATHPEHSRLLGLPSEGQKSPGIARLAPTSIDASGKRQRVPPVPWNDTECARSGGNPREIQSNSGASPENLVFHQAFSLIAKEGDSVKIGSHAIYKSSTLNSLYIGRILEILTSTDNPHNALLVTIQRLVFRDERHAILDLPCLDLTESRDVVSPQNVICAVNVQHDCSSSGCSGFKEKYLTQEHCVTEKTINLVAHSASPNFILNTSSLHNYKFIQTVLPTTLPKPSSSRIPKDNRAQVRANAARQIRQKKKTSETEVQILSTELLTCDTASNVEMLDNTTPIFNGTSKSKGKGKGRESGKVKAKESGRAKAKELGKGDGEVLKEGEQSNSVALSNPLQCTPGERDHRQSLRSNTTVTSDGVPNQNLATASDASMSSGSLGHQTSHLTPPITSAAIHHPVQDHASLKPQSQHHRSFVASGTVINRSAPHPAQASTSAPLYPAQATQAASYYYYYAPSYSAVQSSHHQPYGQTGLMPTGIMQGYQGHTVTGVAAPSGGTGGSLQARPPGKGISKPPGRTDADV